MTSCHGACHPAAQILPITRLLELAEEAAREIIPTQPTSERSKPERQGGYFVVVIEKADHTDVYIPILLGSVPEGNRSRRRKFALEKALRLMLHAEHATSRESADPDREMYPGAMRFRSGNVYYIFSFSGLAAEDDERIVFRLAEKMQLGDATARIAA